MPHQDLNSPIDKILKEKFDEISQDYTLSTDRMAAILKAAQDAVTPTAAETVPAPDSNVVKFPTPTAKPSHSWRSWSIAAGIVLAVAGVVTVQLQSPSAPSTIAQQSSVNPVATPNRPSSQPELQAQQAPLPAIEVAPVEANPRSAPVEPMQWSAAHIEPAAPVASQVQVPAPHAQPAAERIISPDPQDAEVHMAQAPNTPTTTPDHAAKVLQHLRQLEQQGRAEQAEKQLAQQGE